MITSSLPRVGDRLTDYVARVSQLREFKTRDAAGGFYLFKATNASGSMACVVWSGRITFKNGDYLRLSGEMKLHKEAPQFVVNRYEVLAPDAFPPDEFLPVSRRPVSEMVQELEALILEVQDEPLRRLLTRLLLEDPKTAPAYQRAPAAKTHHHSYLGGLLEHHLSVTRRALGLLLEDDGGDRDVLIAASLLHDLGKIQEYDFEGGEIGFSEAGNLQGHVALGYGLVLVALETQGDVAPEKASNLLHVILSHQGRMEFGAAIEPKTREAFLVHYADSADTHLFQIRRSGEEFPDSRLGFAKSLNRVVLGNPQLPMSTAATP